MKIDLLLTGLKELEERGGYRAHLAKPAGAQSPLKYSRDVVRSGRKNTIEEDKEETRSKA